MDFIRSGAVTAIRPWAGSDDTIAIRWFRCAEGAKPFPHEHAFAGMYFEGNYNQEFQGPGLFNREFESVKSTNPGYAGTHFEGNPAWFLSGIPLAHRDDPPAVCADAFDIAEGGIGIGEGDSNVFSGAKVTTAAFVVEEDAVTEIEFDTVEFDTDAYWDGGDGSLLTPPTPGVYHIGGSVTFEDLENPLTYVKVFLKSAGDLYTVPIADTRTVDEIEQLTYAGNSIVHTDQPFRLWVLFTGNDGEPLNVTASFWMYFLGPLPPTPPPVPLLQDSFTDDDATPLDEHEPEVGPLGADVALVGVDPNFAIDSNTAKTDATGDGPYGFAWELDEADVNITLNVTLPASGTSVSGVLLRLSGTNNYWACRLRLDTNVLEILEVSAGVETQRASTPFFPTLGETYLLNVVALGDEITFSVDATEVSYGSASFNQTETRHGLYTYQAGSYGINVFDNIEVIG